MIAKRRPDPRLRFEPEDLGLVEAPRSFFRRPTVAVARDLVGAYLARRWRGRWYGARIVETEAYVGPDDAAAHSFRGRRTARVESATVLTSAEQGAVQTNLARRYGAGVNVSFTQNAALLGGMRIKVGSDVYDGSVQARLNALAESF